MRVILIVILMVVLMISVGCRGKGTGKLPDRPGQKKTAITHNPNSISTTDIEKGAETCPGI